MLAEHLTAEQHAAQIHVDHLIELLGGDLHHGYDFGCACVVDQCVDTAPALQDRIACRFECGLRGDVQIQCEGARAVGTQIAGEGLSGIERNVADGDRITRCVKARGNRGAKTARAAGDEYDSFLHCFYSVRRAASKRAAIAHTCSSAPLRPTICKPALSGAPSIGNGKVNAGWPLRLNGRINDDMAMTGVPPRASSSVIGGAGSVGRINTCTLSSA